MFRIFGYRIIRHSWIVALEMARAELTAALTEERALSAKLTADNARLTEALAGMHAKARDPKTGRFPKARPA